MPTSLKIEQSDVKSAMDRLKKAVIVLSESSRSGAALRMGGFSSVSGLDQAGNSHRNVFNVHEPEAATAMAAHIGDTATLIENNLKNVLAADCSFSRSLSKVGELQSCEGASLDSAMQTPQLVNPVTKPFVFAPPVSAGVPSLSALHSQFQKTDPSRAAAAAEAWQSRADAISKAVVELSGVVAALDSSSETEWVRKAIEQVNRIQWAGGQYAAHSQAMATHTGLLATVAAAEKANTAAAFATWMAAPVESKLVFEQAYMAAFAPRLTSGLVPTVPAFNQLLPSLDAMPGSSFQPDAIVVPQAPEFDRQALPKVVQDAFKTNGYEALAYAQTPSQVVERFGPATPQAMDAIAAGAAPTQAASTGATMPPAVNPSGLAPGASGTSPATAFGPGAGFGGPGGIAGAGSPGGAPRSLAQSLGGGMSPRHAAAGGSGDGVGGRPGGGAGAGSSLRAASGAAAGAGAGAGLGALGRFGGGLSAGGIGAGGVGAGGFGAGGFGAGGFGAGGFGAGGNAGVSGTGGLGSGGLGAGSGSGTAPGVSSVASGAQAGGRGAAAGTPMGAPMGGAAQRGTGEGKKGSKVRAVTSAVEREGNMRALLGKAQPVLPDVIGSNVQVPR